jgi:hypothetical protein
MRCRYIVCVCVWARVCAGLCGSVMQQIDCVCVRARVACMCAYVDVFFIFFRY